MIEKSNIKATRKQKKAVQLMVENGGNASKAMRDAGYSPNTAKTPSKLTDSPGYQDALAQYGLTESLIVESLVEDIKLKKQNRKPELELGAKIRGMLVDRTEANISGRLETDLNESQMSVIANRILKGNKV